ncbi:DUF2169 family type VI secretion system accessory protein [Massilia sp. SM-13]|uniref:DUF2169 family type VI secretion system accessory protein n=1 Tax=Pseudoduganella rhizocola TaxID=3382643 RepID=UPI0038B4F793
MKHIKPGTLGLLKKPYRHRGRHYLVVSALGFFRLGDGAPRFLPDSPQWQKLMGVLPHGQALDEILPKARGEVLLSGSAWAPQGRAVRELTVGLRLGTLSKQLRVLGDRNWLNSLLPGYQATDPLPFTEMPLSYERAYGGPKHGGNPLGCGYTGNPWSPLFGQNHGVLPNIEYPQTPVASPARAYLPASFGPVPPDWSPRKEKLGTFDQHWSEHDAPGFAADMDPLAFNRAPADQWLAEALVGGEAYRLDNLHPERPRIEGRLPCFRARAFVQRAGGALEEVPMTLDTVWFFPGQEIGLLTYHGQAVIGDAEAQDIGAVMVAYEAPQAPKPLAHYEQVFALRSNADTAGLHVYNEGQLTPSLGEDALAQRQAEQAAEAQARQDRQQAATEEIQRDLCARYALPLPEPAPRAAPAVRNRPTARQIAEGDFDLTDIVADAHARAEEVRTDGARRIAELQEQKAALESAYGPLQAAPPDIAAQKNTAFELASVPAYDLLPAALQPAALTPAVDALVAKLKLPAPQDPQLVSELRAKFSASLLLQPGLHRKGRHAAMTPAAPAAPLAPEAAAWLGQQVRQWHQGGAHLAGRDLAGIDLRGADFSGADLREVMLENADLSGASFAGADLAGAVLTGAVLDGADFSGARLRGANLCGSSAVAANFAGADMTQVRASRARWRGCGLQRVRLSGCLAQHIDLSGACLDGADLGSANLLQAQAPHSSWQRCVLDKSILLKANLAHADFRDARLERVTLLDAVLRHSRWGSARLHRIVGGGKADWSHADLRTVQADHCGWHGACFAGADLSDAQCLHCSFDECDFSDARLYRGLFAGSRFMNAKLCRANAAQADFYQAMGRKADFSGADLTQASLVQMDLGGAIFTGARLDKMRSVA